MHFWLCFVPLFVAVDAIGVLPLFLGLTQGLPKARIAYIIRQSVVTALVVAVAFLVGGQAILRLLNITIPDFMVAGGVLLFVLSMTDLVRVEKTQRHVDAESLGAVPLGVPLITGPAVLTTLLLLSHEHGLLWTSIALTLNILIAGLVFHFAESIHRVLGKAGSKTASKIASLLLAAIAVMMIRKGIVAFIVAGVPT